MTASRLPAAATAAALSMLLTGANASAADNEGLEGDAASGARLYETTCKGCHSVSIAPSLNGVVGRPVAGDQAFAGYTEALRSSAPLTWTPDNLDTFLAAPAELVPGTLMVQAVADPQARADVIAYLGTLPSRESVIDAPPPEALPQPAAAPGGVAKVAVRRLTESEYRHSIADVLGADIEINARFEPERREAGLLAIGNATLSLTSSGFEQYFALAESIAGQALGEHTRDAVAGCTPADPAAADASCAAAFIQRYGERLFRRPLTSSEAARRIEIASAGAEQAGDFYAGLELALASLLVAPEFLFRVETAEPVPGDPDRYRLDGYTKATRLSFLFWNTTPDESLLEAARTGAIHTRRGLEEQIGRLSASPRFEEGVRAFLADMLQLDGFENLIKDPAIYPKFNQSVADGAREQMLKTAIELLVHQERDYRDLFVANETYINRPLASVYRVPFSSTEEWAPYSFPASSGRSGILTQVGFLSLFAHPGTSSPTRRGIKIHEIFMCEPTPDPPADVDFSTVTDSKEGTVRGRLLDHMENPGCIVCHRRSDPPGLALEHFDGLGQLRRYENGAPIDVSATLNGVQFEGAQGLGRLLRNDARVPACLVRNVYAYGVGREPDVRDESHLEAQTAAFADSGYRLPDLMARLASQPEFFRVVMPDGVGGTASVAPTDTERLQQPVTGLVR